MQTPKRYEFSYSKFRQRRGAAGYTTYDARKVAREAGCGLINLYEVEKGERGLRLSQAIFFADLFGCEVRDFCRECRN